MTPRGQSAVMAYRLSEPVNGGSFVAPTLERSEDFTYKPGVHEPKSEQEEALFEHLVSIGLATRAKGKD